VRVHDRIRRALWIRAVTLALIVVCGWIAGSWAAGFDLVFVAIGAASLVLLAINLWYGWLEWRERRGSRR
jgi:hypothetical protein